MKKPVSISSAESVVMEVIWRAHPVTTEEVVDALSNQETWQEPTVKTLLNRLLRKGAISARKDGRRYQYSPVLRRDQWVSRESESLLERLFGGRVAPLVSHFTRHRKLTKSDITELKRIIQELNDEQ